MTTTIAATAIRTARNLDRLLLLIDVDARDQINDAPNAREIGDAGGFESDLVRILDRAPDEENDGGLPLWPREEAAAEAWLRAGRPPAAGRLEVRDQVCAGLVLRLTANGTASWSTRGLLPDGRHGGVSLGVWPSVGVAEARRRALAATAAVQAAAVAQAALPTVADAIARWRAAKDASWSASHRKGVERVARLGILPTLGNRKLAELGRTDWIAVIEQARPRGPGAIAHLFRVVSSFLGWCEVTGLIAAHPLPRRAASTLAPPPAPRTRALSDDEVVAVWRAAGQLAPKRRAFVRLLILSGCRRSEVAGICAGEVDRTARRWVIPAHRAKNKTERAIALGPLALVEIDAVWPSDDPVPGFRLLGHTHIAPLGGLSHTKTRLDALAPIAAVALARPPPNGSHRAGAAEDRRRDRWRGDRPYQRTFTDGPALRHARAGGRSGRGATALAASRRRVD